jgi:hypothetical protein
VPVLDSNLDGQNLENSCLSTPRLSFQKSKIYSRCVGVPLHRLHPPHTLGTVWCFVYHLESRHRPSTSIAPPYKFSTSFSSNNAMAVAVDSDIDHSYEIKDVSERTSSGV